MTPRKQPLPRSFVPLLFVISALGILIGCGGGGGAGPSPIPTPPPAPTPPVARQVLSQAFTGRPDIIGFSIDFPVEANGTYTFKALWSPGPPTGQIYLLIVQSPSDFDACYHNFSCAGMLTKDVSDAQPKEIKGYRFPSGITRAYIWTRPVSGNTSGFLEVWFTPNS